MIRRALRAREVGALALFVLSSQALAQKQDWYMTKAMPAEIASVEHAVASELRDPESSRFAGIYKLEGSSGGAMFCGRVNAKNGYGGYSGETPFFYDESGTTMADSESNRMIVLAVCDKPVKP